MTAIFAATSLMGCRVVVSRRFQFVPRCSILQTVDAIRLIPMEKNSNP